MATTSDLTPAPLTISRSITIDADSAEVWRELTDPDALADWLGMVVEGTLSAGSTGIQRDDEGPVRRVGFIEVDHGRALRWEWTPETDPDAASTVSVDLAEDAEGRTVVTVTETRAAAASCSIADARIDEHDLGWDRRLLGLELRFVATSRLVTL